jgi:spore maturation protein CgeB
MTRRPRADDALDIVVLGLSITSSWGNGHATTWRALAKGLHTLGHRVTFLERDKPWYAANRDMSDPPFCTVRLYHGLDDLAARFAPAIEAADAVMVGSYVPDGVDVIDAVLGRASGPVAFYDIDTPVTLAALNRGREEYIARRQIGLLDAYFSFSGGGTLARLEQEFGARLALPLYCSVDTDLYHPGEEACVWDLGYLGTYSPDRQPTLERLLIEPARRRPGRRFVVAGPSYPADIDWPANVERIEHLPPSEHARFYRRQRYTLNVTRADMIAAGWSPSVRLFEAAACGTPVVSDAWPGLGEIFPVGEAILVAKTSDDVVALLQDPAPDRPARIAAAALALVRSRHDAVARARELAAGLRLAGAGRPLSRSGGRTSRTG